MSESLVYDPTTCSLLCESANGTVDHSVVFDAANTDPFCQGSSDFLSSFSCYGSSFMWNDHVAMWTCSGECYYFAGVNPSERSLSETTDHQGFHYSNIVTCAEGGSSEDSNDMDWALSDEYTTAILIANTENALPPYPGTFTGTCSAYRNLSSDESSYSIRRFRYEFTFDAATESFVIHWVERFTPADNGPPSDTSRCEQVPVDATETSIYEVLEPSSNGTITIEDVYVEAAAPEVKTASIRDGQFVITVPDLDCSTDTGTLDLMLRRQGSNDEVVLKTLEDQSPGTVTVKLDEVMDVDATSLDSQDGIVFDRAAARWRASEVDVTSDDQNLDVPVEVLSQRTISNYFSPTWGGTWLRAHVTKGVYPAGQFPSGLYNVDRQKDFLNALDPKLEGLAMDGNTVIRLHDQPVQPGFPPVEFLPPGSGRYGYIEFPDRDQREAAPGSTVRFLRSTSVAVRPDADRLSYRTADEVYVPSFGIRTCDDRGGLNGNVHQIDVWIGRGDSTLQSEANRYGIEIRTCLKLLNQ
jgi:hypothetical protein